jgi:menaquinone-dependent protoporphyrinogen IX oxidase
MKATAIFALLTAVLASSAFCQTDSVRSPGASKVRILLAKGNSYMENEVAAIVKDSLTDRGCEVVIVPLKQLNGQNPREFKATILFHSVKSSGLSPAAKEFVKLNEEYGTQSNLLVCNVLGEKWENKDQEEASVTSATKTLKPSAVASKILANLSSILQHE